MKTQKTNNSSASSVNVVLSAHEAPTITGNNQTIPVEISADDLFEIMAEARKMGESVPAFLATLVSVGLQRWQETAPVNA